MGKLDEVIRMGSGLRWAQVGLFVTCRIAGGEAGMEHIQGAVRPAADCIAGDGGLFTVESHDQYLAERQAGERPTITTGRSLAGARSATCSMSWGTTPDSLAHGSKRRSSMSICTPAMPANRPGRCGRV